MRLSEVAEEWADKKERIEKLRHSEPVEISGNEIEGSSDIRLFKKNAIEYGKTLQGEYVNEDQGKVIQLQRGRRNGGLKEVLQHDLSDVAHIKSIAAIPDIIRKSIYIETRRNDDLQKNPDVRGYEHYVCGLNIGGEDYTVHSIVAEDRQGNRYYDHKLSHIEKGKLLDFIEAKQPIEQILTPTSGTEPTIRSERKIKELISLLQVDDEDTWRGQIAPDDKPQGGSRLSAEAESQGQIAPAEPEAGGRLSAEAETRGQIALADKPSLAGVSRSLKDARSQTGEEAKRSHAEGMAMRFNTPIRIVTERSELTHSNPEIQEAMRKNKGWYDPRTGQVVVVLPNNADVEEVAQTVFHEVVAHKGLREMIGEENYDACCDEIYNHLKDELKKEVDEDATRRFMDEPEKGYEYARRKAVDEKFGRLSEKGFEDFTEAERGIWAKLKVKVLEAINKFLVSLKLPKWVKLGDNELRYMLWRSHERLTNKSDYVDMARDAAKRAELGIGQDVAMRKDTKKSSTNEARLNDLDPANAEHSAKVAKKIETAKGNLEQLAETYRRTTDPRGFLTDLAQSVGVIVGTSGSGYRTLASTTAMIFHTSSTSYSRETHTSARNLKRIISGEVNEEFVAKQILRTLGIKTYSEQFDEQLAQQVAGTLPQNHIYSLGTPGGILQSAGFPDMPIEMQHLALPLKQIKVIMYFQSKRSRG